MKQEDMTVVAVRIPNDILKELDLACAVMHRKRGPSALELIKTGLDIMSGRSSGDSTADVVKAIREVRDAVNSLKEELV